MNYSENPYASPMGPFAAMAEADERSSFITKTYLHLAGAIALFVALETMILATPGVEKYMKLMFASRYSILIIMGLFIAVSYIAQNWAESATSIGKQYAGLALYVVAEAVIFSPMIYIASVVPKYDGVILSAAVATLGLFAVLTAVVFITRKDFSFLRGVLIFGGFAALGLIIMAILFNFQLGPIFTYVMIAFACSYILYDTSNVLHHYRVGQHVAASLALFASVALLFWYILRLFLRSRD
jgi:FtsH-binding integral membrane protein